MGTINTPDELGHKPSPNGYDDIYGPPNWRYYLLNKRPQNTSAKRFVIFLSFDVLAFFILLGIIDKLTTTKEVIALIVTVLYVTVRLAITIVKLFAFIGRNHEGIKKGAKTFKDIFHE